MSSASEQLAVIKNRLDGVQTKLLSFLPNSILYSYTGEVVLFGCKVTQGDSTNDSEVLLTGQAAGDTAYFNSDGLDVPTRDFHYRNIAGGKDGAIRLNDTTTEVDAAPATGLARYDIAYIFVGPTGSGFDIATGTPSAAVKTDFDTNGLDTSAYGSATITDPTLPVGALPVARIYVEDVYTGIQDARIADLRSYASAGSSGTVTSVGISVPTGLQVTGSPVTESGTIAISFTSGYSIPTDADQTNWDTAYGWGDHALAGYLDAADIGTSVQAFSAVLDATTASYTTAEETKLGGIETGATADQSDSEIAAAYGNEVGQVSSGEKTAGTETGLRTFSPKDVADMAGTHGGGGGGGGNTSSVSYTEFTGSGTWNKPTGATMVYVEVIGAGGGGGQATGTTACGGGGGGSFLSGFFRASELGSTETVTIGSGGAAGGPNSAGSDGGNTTFGSHLTGGGGKGGGGPSSGFGGDGGAGEPGRNTTSADFDGPMRFQYTAGGGGYAETSGDGASCIEGGAGGGGSQDVGGGSGGTSQKGGDGGDGGTGGAGTAPGGGGGAASDGGSAGAGAAGRCRVWTWTDGSS